MREKLILGDLNLVFPLSLFHSPYKTRSFEVTTCLRDAAIEEKYFNVTT